LGGGAADEEFEGLLGADVLGDAGEGEIPFDESS
jgi:hypothetical protein